MVLGPTTESEGRRFASCMVMLDAFVTALLFLWGFFMFLSLGCLDRENSGNIWYTFEVKRSSPWVHQWIWSFLCC